MLRTVTLALLCLLVWAQWDVGHAQAERRVALVLGNSAYTSVARLKNPANDARLIAKALQNAGFDSVQVETDLEREKFARVLSTFAQTAAGADIALIYYAGHGVEADGKNWLIPVDARLPNARQLNFEAVSLDTVIAAVGSARSLQIVILDACRNNPFAANWLRGGGGRSLGRGLADVEAAGTLVLYSARGGTIAQDGAGANSPFASALAQRLPEPGVDVRLLVSKVRDDVLRMTDNEQEPFAYGSLPGVPLQIVPGAPVPVTSRDEAVARAEEQYWALCCSRKDVEPAALETYLAKVKAGDLPGAHVADATRRLSAQWERNNWPNFLTRHYLPNPKWVRHALKWTSFKFLHPVWNWSADWGIWFFAYFYWVFLIALAVAPFQKQDT